jgi:hypothetical protein
LAKASGRFGSAFKLRVAESNLFADASLKGLATQAGIDHSPLHYWKRRYLAEEPTLDIVREETITEAKLKIGVLER